MSRTNNSIKNIKYAIIGQAIGLFMSFINRIVFVRTLTVEYLGINGLFTNIVSILSLAELGIGSAIVFSMYKPLADRDEYKLKALMILFKKAYIIIGIIVALLGVALIPFLNYFIKEMPDVSNIKFIYMIFVINASLSYFFSYKRSLIIADEKRYITTIYRYGFYFILNIAQIMVLILIRSFILFILLQLLNTFLENVAISRRADIIYPFLKGRSNICLSKSEKKTIVKNVKAMILHKIGGTIVICTDNLLISKFIGVTAVGIYSNYLLIITALNTIFGLGFESITASIGNLGVTETNDKQRFIFNCVDLIGFWLFGITSICLVNLLNPFVKIWIGDEYLYPMYIVIFIILNFYLTGRRKSVLTFKDAFGLFWYDRYKPLLESGINLLVSIILASKIGVAGVLMGTTISTLVTCFWIEPLVLYKYGFKCSVKQYLKNYWIYTFVMLVSGVITFLISCIIPGEGLIVFLCKFLTCFIVSNILFLIYFWRTDELKYLLNILKSIFQKIIRFA